MDRRKALVLVALTVVAAALVAAIVCANRRRRGVAAQTNEPYANAAVVVAGETCGGSHATCGAADPVSDPAYNMVQIAKQSVLLEEHLAEKPKRCKDCCVKHYLLLTALAEEAVCLAGKDVGKYPLMEGNVAFYAASFKRWLEVKDDEDKWLPIHDELRARRKELVAVYVLKSGAGEQ